MSNPLQSLNQRYFSVTVKVLAIDGKIKKEKEVACNELLVWSKFKVLLASTAFFILLSLVYLRFGCDHITDKALTTLFLDGWVNVIFAEWLGNLIYMVA